METELQQALRIVRKWLESPFALFESRLVGRVFLEQRERVAALEAERAMYEAQWRRADHDRTELQAALAQARVEGARKEQVAFIRGAQWRLEHHRSLLLTTHDATVEAARRYPAPAAPAGEPQEWSCGKCGQSGERWEGCGMSECEANVPDAVRRAEIAKRYDPRHAPTPEPEPMRVYVMSQQWYPQLQERATGDWVTLTPEDCRRIVALGSRPTQTAEGQ